jgi:hypothetical protein
MKNTVWWCAVATAGLIACGRRGPDLEPAPAANETSGIGIGAVDTASGVRVEVRSDAWRWNPPDLPAKITPLLVQLENTGRRNFLLVYRCLIL